LGELLLQNNGKNECMNGRFGWRHDCSHYID